MKVALVNPNYLNSHDEPNVTYLPLGLAYIAAVIRASKRHELKIIDAAAYCLSNYEVERQLKEFGAEIVGVGCATEIFESALEICKIAKKNKMISVMGGPHPTVLPVETLGFSEIDIVVLGEGEYTFLDLLDSIDKKVDLKKIKGIMFKQNNKGKIKIIKTLPREPIKNLDELPLPARDLFPWKLYPSYTSFSRKLPAMHMITSRGCPFKCTFCGSGSLWKGCRSRSPKSIVDEIEQIIRQFGVREIFIMDDTFNIDLKRCEEICDEIIRRKIKILLKVQARVYPINEAIIKKMKRAGVYCIYYGVESGNQDVLNDIKKGITIKQIENAFRLTKARGIKTFGFFMIGLPKDNQKTVEDTLKLALKIDPDFANFTILAPYPGTEVYELAIKENSLKRIGPGEIPIIPRYKNKNMSAEKLEYNLRKIYKKFYLRPKYLFKRLISIRTLTELKTNIISGLPFFRGKNPFNVKNKWIMRKSE